MVGPATKTTCPYCGVGCGVLVTRRSDGGIEVAGDPDHPSNFGRLCSKGMALGETIGLEGRQLSPMVDGVEVDWNTALDATAERLRTVIDEHGPDAVGLYGSGQLLTEDYYVANKLMKGFIGSANIDTNSRLCMASSVAGHKRAFGADTVPGCYEDLEEADLVVLVGSNLAWCHPVLFQRILAARSARPDMRLVVIDPRRTDSAEVADLHLSIASDGDVALFLGLLAHLAAVDALDTRFVEEHTHGIEDALALAAPWTIAETAQTVGLSAADIGQFFDLFTTRERVVTIFSQGVNQSVAGSDKVNAIINCHLATGRIGRPGMGPFSVTGQPNAMGGREVGGLANMVAAHMDFDKVDTVGRFWQAPRMARQAGLKAIDLFAALETKDIKAIWIMATNPVVSLPDADRARNALLACRSVIVSDMYATTDTARCADIFLPAAGWGEKAGTVTNSERRISRQRSFLPLPGQARPDWWIICEVAKRLGFADAFAFQSPAEIFAEHAALSGFENDGTRDFDIAALGRQDYELLAPTQWPIRRDGCSQERHFGDGKFYTRDGRARFIATEPSLSREPASRQMVLNTGRVRDHWHTMTRTGNSPRLSSRDPEPFAEIHPQDAKRCCIRDASLVELSNGRSRSLVRAVVTERQREGSLFAPMHWSGTHSSAGRINAAVNALVDPVSGQPGLKMAVVSAGPARVEYYGFSVSRNRPDCEEATYWAIARAVGGWRTEFAFASGDKHLQQVLCPAPESAAQVVRSFGAGSGVEVLSFMDAGLRRQSIAGFDSAGLVFALWLSREPVQVSREWAVSQLTQRIENPLNRSAILSGRPGSGRAGPGALVCSCFGVGTNQIAALAASGAATSVDAVGVALKAGTNCGACRTDIRRILNEHRLQAAE